MKNPTVPTIVVASVICLALGAVGGYYARHFTPTKEKPSASGPPPGTPAGMGGGMGGMGGAPGGGKGGPPAGGGMGGGDMGGMMGGMGGPAQASAELKRIIRSLNTVQRVQEKGLTAAQVQELLPLLKAIQSAEKLPDEECKAKTEEIYKILADAQKDTLQEVFPQGGGFGGGGMGGMGGGAGGGKGGGKGGPPGGGGMGGQKADPDKPFASERDKKSLEALIAVLEGKGQK